MQAIVVIAAVEFGLLDEACAQEDEFSGNAAGQLGVAFPAFGVGSVLVHEV